MNTSSITQEEYFIAEAKLKLLKKAFELGFVTDVDIRALFPEEDLFG